MKINLPLPQEKKLTVICRVEPGCLGPDGLDHIEDFCNFAQKQVEPIDFDFIHWLLVPRFDKSLPEMQYKIGDKRLTQSNAEKYLEMFNKNLDEFEEHLNEKLTQLINQFLGR